MGVDDPSMYQLQSHSPIIGMGKLISGSTDTLNFMQNNGGMDYFGNFVSSTDPPNIGASNFFSTLTESKFKNKVHASPSITLDEVKLSVANFSGELIIHIYDVNGKWVSTQTGDTVSLNKYKKGLYILEVRYNHLNECITIVKL